VRKDFEAKLSNPQTEIIELEYRIKDLSDDYLYISDRSFILRDENGKPIRVIGASQDITDRKKAEEVLRASEESYRYLFNNNPASILIWDLTTYEILDVNETAIEQYGYSKEEFLHKSMLEIRNESERQTFIDFAAEAANKPDFRRSATWKHLDKFDNDIYMDISSHRIWFNGKYVMLALANNITERVYLEQELEEERLLKQQEITNAIIAAQEQERSEMGTELHDNINQILATSRLYLDCAIADEKLRPKLLQDSRNYIVNAMSEIRKLSKSLLPPALSKVGLIETLDDLVASLKPVNDITFNTDWAFFDESNVPDKLRLTIFRIVQEQLNNIQKHAKATLVYITLKQVNNEIDLEITDNGIGFDTNIKRPGVGLQNINTRANQHKGVLIVYSEPNKGCQLIVKFPFEQTPIEE
jgi:PAS domain S-box-containing protein